MGKQMKEWLQGGGMADGKIEIAGNKQFLQCANILSLLLTASSWHSLNGWIGVQDSLIQYWYSTQYTYINIYPTICNNKTG